MLEIMEDFRRAQQSLGRYAAPIEADPAEIVAFDDRGLEAELRRPDRRHIAAGAGPDNENIEICVSHSLSCLPDPIECTPDWACNACLYHWGKRHDQNRWRTCRPGDLSDGAGRLWRRDQGLQHHRGQERVGGIGAKI